MTKATTFFETGFEEPTVTIDNHEYCKVVCVNCGFSANVPVYCGNRFCNICSSARQKRVKKRINWMIKSRPHIKGTLLKHLTLTMRNSEDLPTMVKSLLRAFRRLRQRAYFKQCISGGAFVVELTNKGNQWHAHIHAVIQSHRVEWEKLRNLWKICSKGNTGVFIQNIPPVEAVRYLTKYVSKSELPEDLQQIASDALKGFRLFNPFGSWYAINLEYKPEPSRCPKCDAIASYLPWDFIMGNWKMPYY